MIKLTKGKWLLLGVGLSVVLLIAGYAGLQVQAKFKPYKASWPHMIHKDVTCEKCHGGSLENTVKEANKFYSRLTGEEYKVPKVNSEYCAGCHSASSQYSKAKDVVNEGANRQTKNLKFVHKAHFEEGFSCVECHRMVAHGRKPFDPNDPQIPDTMITLCSKCHDVRTKSSIGQDRTKWTFEQLCTKCHKFDPTKNPNAFSYKRSLRPQ